MQADILYMDNQRLLHLIANKHKQWAYVNGITYDELISIGNLAFMLAVDNFDEKCGVKFSTYLHKTVSNSMVIEITKTNNTIDYPLHIKRYAQLVRKDNNTSLSEDDIGVVYGVSRSTAQSIKNYIDNGNLVTLTYEETGITPMDAMASNDVDLFDFKQWIDTLNEVDRGIVKQKLEGKTNKEIAQERGISGMAITKRLQKIQRSLYLLMQESGV